MSSPHARCSFEDTVIDFAGRRLVRAGVEQPLEPKAFSVLALLAGEPGRVFARDDILDAVWGHHHVTPGVLNRIVTLLRQALGEDAHHPRLLHTVHAVGYRFDLPAPGAAETTPVTVETAPTDPPPAVAIVPNAALAPPRHWPKRALLALLAVAGLAVAAASLLPQRAVAPTSAAATEPAAQAAQNATPTLVVMPLKPIGDGDSVRVIAEGLGEELICSLAQVQGLRVIARESTRLAAAESEKPAQLVQRLGITHALEGNLQQSGQSLRVRLRLVEAQDGRALWTRDFDRDASEVLLLQREIAEAVATSLALKLGLTDAPSRTGDADFLRRYLSARALVTRHDLPPEASTDLAESQLRELVRERPDDARARAGLALALDLRAQRRPALATGLREEALREATMARELDANLPEPYAVLASNACHSRLWERCLQLFDETKRLSNDANVVYGSAIMLARLGYLDRAEAVVRELAARDPISGNAGFLLGRLLDTQGRHEEARRELNALPADATAHARWFNAAWRGDHAAALRIAKTEMGAPERPDTDAARLAPGYITASRALIDPPLWPQALVEFEHLERGSDLTHFARVLTPDAAEHAADLIDELDRLRQQGYSSWDLLLWTKDLAFLRRDPAFQDYLRDNGILDHWRKHGFPPQCRPQGEGAYCE